MLAFSCALELILALLSNSSIGGCASPGRFDNSRPGGSVPQWSVGSSVLCWLGLKRRQRSLPSAWVYSFGSEGVRGFWKRKHKNMVD